MPVKNTGIYLNTCLDSIIEQSEQDWELLAVDDGSSDESLSTLRQYAHRDERISVLQNKGSGIIDALSLAHSHSSGDYITRMDSDDIMAKSKLSELKNRLIQIGKAHVAVGLIDYFSGEKLGEGYKKYAAWLNQLTLTENNFSEIYKECVIPSPCWMIHRDDLNACGAFNSDIYPEDYDLCFRFYQSGYKIAGISKILHHWRDYPHRTSRNHEHYADNRFLALKIKYFLKLDYQKNNELILWGGGKKGKWLARKLIDQRIQFRWVTNNQKKIGKHIYHKLIESTSRMTTSSPTQIIIAVANEDEQQDILRQLKKFDDDVRAFWFC
jgi:glycosyltransferase involved in cell wall biosynthesis